MPSIKVELDIPEDSEFIINHKNSTQRDRVPLYSRLGGISMNSNFDTRNNRESFPELFKTLATLSKSATWMLWTLADNYNPQTNIATLKAIDQSQSNKITKAYKELNSNKIIKRIKQNHYLVNPLVLIPDNGFMEPVKKHWRSI